MISGAAAEVHVSIQDAFINGNIFDMDFPIYEDALLMHQRADSSGYWLDKGIFAIIWRLFWPFLRILINKDILYRCENAA